MILFIDPISLISLDLESSNHLFMDTKVFFTINVFPSKRAPYRSKFHHSTPYIPKCCMSRPFGVRCVSHRFRIFWIATRPRVALDSGTYSCFWSAAMYCRFDIFWIAACPRAALDCDTSRVALESRPVPVSYPTPHSRTEDAPNTCSAICFQPIY